MAIASTHEYNYMQLASGYYIYVKYLNDFLIIDTDIVSVYVVYHYATYMQ